MKTFIEIGSCDFRTLNHLSDHGWLGIIVDPVKKYLDNLDRKPNVVYENVAISDKRGALDLYQFREDLINKDYDFAGMSTIHPIEENLHLMDKISVEAITYQDLIERNGIERVDFLKIDTEGHDLTILKTVIFDGPLRPQIIKVEHEYCSDIEMKEFLEERGYYVEVEKYDMFAISLK